MFKTISAALLAVSVIAAPAMAAGTNKTAQAPAAKEVPAAKPVQAPVIKNVQTNNEQGKTQQSKTGLLNANAKVHHHKHYRHQRHHEKMSALKPHAKVSFKPAAKSHSKVSSKHAAPTAKRG
jgi:hypothetical protein